jgi:transcriptional regulator with XRE-family HTH domain
MNTVGSRIKELRLSEKLTQQQVADILNIDRSNYSKYELGKLELNNEMLIKTAKYFKVTTDYLLGLEE